MTGAGLEDTKETLLQNDTLVVASPALRASLSGRKDVVNQCLELELVPQYLKSSLMCLCDVIRALINSLVC